ncbi:MAG: hypothetical protein HYS04_09380 [Acidobacteria bacterium]|nr:hypothetical protein [Acidobacteriota bacterium]
MAEPFDAASLVRGHITYLPVVPGRLEFAEAVRRAILAAQPQVIAVELPVSLEPAYREAIERLPRITVLLYPDDQNEEQAIYVPVEPGDPFVEAVRSGLDLAAEVMFVEPDLAPKPHLAAPYPDAYSLRSIGYEKYVEMYRLHPREYTGEERRHAAAIAWKLQGADPLARVVVVISLNLLELVLESMEVPQDAPEQERPRQDVQLLNPHPDCLAEILVEYPYLQHLYDEARLSGEGPIDRRRTQLEVMRHAEKTYEENTGDKLSHWQRRVLARYTRNLAAMNSELVASVFDLAVAARSIVDDNYGWEVWESANRYPAQSSESDLETVNLSGEEVWLNTRRIRLRRRLPNFKKRVRPSALKRRKKEAYPGEWAEQIHGTAICSYPPEDLVIENYGRFLKKKAKSILSEERERTYRFTTSLLDGIDLRETVRNWHEKKIYVKQQERIAGEVGSIVVIFDADRDERYRYLTTWLGEHQNESDMAFYSTNPFDQVVGPGIGRAEYGGFLMSLPPRRMFDVWSDPDYEFAETKAERLLLAGIDYSVERYTVYVAARPPRSIFRSVAARSGQQILYIPIGQLSPTQLKKIRVVHVLDGYDKREIAKGYIW